VHFCKQWMESQDFYAIKSYSLTVLVLFYLQQKNLMPSIETVHLGVPEERTAGKSLNFASS
jgi:hypothetical protein